MVTNVDSLISQIQQLSRDDQQKVVRFLLVELDGERDTGWEEAWSEELERRRKLEAEGKITSMPWSEACARLRERYP